MGPALIRVLSGTTPKFAGTAWFGGKRDGEGQVHPTEVRRLPNTGQADQKHADYVSTAGLKLYKIIFLVL